MKTLRMQPAFTVDLAVASDEALRKIKKTVRNFPHAKVVGHCAEFTVEPSQRRFWSPHLSVQLSDTDNGSQLYARFSPRPEIWTFVMLLYFFMAFLICCGAIWGYVQWFMKHTPWALTMIPASLMVIAMLHVASLVGQRLSADQMEGLRQQLDQSLEGIVTPAGQALES